MINPAQNFMLTKQQQEDLRRIQEEKQKKISKEFKIAKEQLMRQMGVIEIPIIVDQSHPMKGLVYQPDTVILPKQWKEGETYIEKEKTEETPVPPQPPQKDDKDNSRKATEKLPKEEKTLKNNGHKAKKTK